MHSQCARVLIAEDEPMVADVVARYHERYGYEGSMLCAPAGEDGALAYSS